MFFLFKIRSANCYIGAIAYLKKLKRCFFCQSLRPRLCLSAKTPIGTIAGSHSGATAPEHIRKRPGVSNTSNDASLHFSCSEIRRTQNLSPLVCISIFFCNFVPKKLTLASNLIWQIFETYHRQNFGNSKILWIVSSSHWFCLCLSRLDFDERTLSEIQPIVCPCPAVSLSSSNSSLHVCGWFRFTSTHRTKSTAVWRIWCASVSQSGYVSFVAFFDPPNFV